MDMDTASSTEDDDIIFEDVALNSPMSVADDAASPPAQDCWHMVISWIRLRHNTQVHSSPYDSEQCY
jgi:hypothetical protein